MFDISNLVRGLSQADKRDQLNKLGDQLVPGASLDHHQRLAVQAYGASSTSMIATLHRRHAKTPEPDDSNEMPHIRCLQSACVVQCTTDDAILWRGWWRRDAQVRNLQVGAVLNVPCFLSTSMCAVEAGRFVYPSTLRIPRVAPLLTRITVPVGSPARHLPGREGEILFPAHSSLKLTAVIAAQINTAEGLESGFIYEMEYQQPPTRYLDCNNL